METDSPAPADTPRTPPAQAAPVPARSPERAARRDPGPGPTLREAAAPGLDAPDPGAPPRGYRAVFAVTEFRAVFAAHLLSLLGVVVSELALTVLVYDLTGSPLLSALTFALGLLPYLIGGTLFAGVADRYPARRVLVVCDLLCAACVAVMLVPATPVAGLLALRCLVAAIAPVFTGTRMAALTDILGEGDLYVLGRSLLRIVSQSAMLIGFGAGGVLLTVLSPRGAITVTVVTFLCSAALLRFGTRDRPARAGAGTGGGTLLKESLSGARLVLGDRRVRALMLLFWLPAMFVVAPEALAAPYADAIGASPAALGLLLCAMAVGHIGAELFVGSALSPRNRSRIVLPVAAAGLLPLLVYAVRPGLPLALAALALAGAGAAYVIGLDQWFVDAVPQELRGRAMTLLTAGLMTVQGLGMALAGLAAEFFPVHQVVAGSGIIGTVCTLLLVAEVRRTAPGRMSDTEGRDGADRHVTSR
ncbi:MFS transporter [Streptomyces sp. SID4928]|uniref:MFS transporter n=1 Tax=unclassified Streptomyces TaxID=2593676 RepID=UPI0001C19726|nr:MFS transporter [Streptomyces sp. ACT-1]EGE41719.1 major facilitator superfamily MFS_1 [Streptomyces sp. ACT-1]MYR49774.1 MFS transporter [Streptomyces sp. SID4928]